MAEQQKQIWAKKKTRMAELGRTAKAKNKNGQKKKKTNSRTGQNREHEQQKQNWAKKK